MKNIIILFFLFACCPSIFGQTPGFKGKKHFLEYDLYYMLAIGGPTANGRMYEHGDIAISTRHNFKYNYVVSRHGLIGVSLDLLKTGLEVSWEDAEGNFHTEFNQLRSNAIGIHYNSYFMKRGSLSPIGLYHHFEGKYITSTGVNGVLENKKVHSLYTGYGLGFRKIFSNKFFINFSGQLGWTWGNRGYSEDLEKNLRNQVKERIYSHYIFENNIGIGILLF